MEVGIRVEGEDPLTGIRTHTASAYATFVALDAAGKPTEVPSLVPETAAELRRQVDAEIRRSHRLIARKARAERNEAVLNDTVGGSTLS